MPKNEGKKFEEDFKNSIPEKHFRYRLKDGTAGFKGQKNENVRFQSTNICDFLISTPNVLWLIELKSHKGKSIPKKCFKESQVKGLREANCYDNVCAGYIINFRDLEMTYWISEWAFDNLWYDEKKSISIKDVSEYGILIPQRKKVSRYHYELEELLG